MKGLKKEKYISLYRDKYLVIRISTKTGMFNQTVTIADYPTPAQAMNAAIAIRDAALAERHTEKLVAHTPTVKEVFDATFEMFGYSIKTWNKHIGLYNASIIQFESIEIKKLTAAEIMKSITAFAQDHSDATVTRLISVWHSIFQAAQMMGYPVVDHSLTVRANRPKSKIVAEQRDVMATDEEIETFLDVLSTYNSTSIKGIYNARMVEMIVYTMLYTGCRPAEAIALTRDDINLLTNEISINKSVGSTHTTSGKTIRTTKTRQSRRVVPIAMPLKERLIDYLSKHEYDLLFCDMSGNPLEIDWLSNYVRLVSKKAGVHVTLYMLRHKFSTDLLKIADLRTVQDLMGHESGSMTVSYARSTDDERKNAIDSRRLT